VSEWVSRFGWRFPVGTAVQEGHVAQETFCTDHTVSCGGCWVSESIRMVVVIARLAVFPLFKPVTKSELEVPPLLQKFPPAKGDPAYLKGSHSETDYPQC
jgi:hypothetical protein